MERIASSAVGALSDDDLAALTALGLPLAGRSASDVTRDVATLRHHVERALAVLDTLDSRADDGESERFRHALHALVLALTSHFPSATRHWLATSPRLRALAAEPPTGRVLKLRRIALARIAEYL